MATVLGPIIPRHATSFDKIKPTAIIPSSRPQTAAPTKQPVSGAADPYYGHEVTARMCARYVNHLFACPDAAAALTAPSNSPSLALFIAYALHRTRLHQSVTFAALFLLQRLKQRFPAARGSSGHRLYLSAFMIASKVICDDTYSNKSWCIVGQSMFALREVNQMEREMCAYLDWELNVDPDSLKEFERQVRKNFCHGGSGAPIALPQPATRKPVYVHTEPATITVATPPTDSAPRRPESRKSSSSSTRYVSPDETAARARYPTPETSPEDAPDTPESSRSMETSPENSPSPRTPSTIEEMHARVVAQTSPYATGELTSTSAVKARAMQRALAQEPGAPPHMLVPVAGSYEGNVAVVSAAHAVKARHSRDYAVDAPAARAKVAAHEAFAIAEPMLW